MVATLVLVIVFRKEKDPIDKQELTKVEDYFPTVLLVGVVLLLIINSFIPGKYKPDAIEGLINGIICMTLFLIGLIRKFIKTKDTETFIEALKSIDYDTILLLAGLFIVIGGIMKPVWLRRLVRYLQKSAVIMYF